MVGRSSLAAAGHKFADSGVWVVERGVEAKGDECMDLEREDDEDLS